MKVFSTVLVMASIFFLVEAVDITSPTVSRGFASFSNQIYNIFPGAYLSIFDHPQSYFNRNFFNQGGFFVTMEHDAAQFQVTKLKWLHK